MSYSSLPLTSKLFQLTTLTLALTLAGCGGGDGGDTIAPKPDLGVTQPGTGGGENGSIPEAIGIYILSEKTQLLTGEDKTTLNIRVTDSNGGIISNTPVNINIADAALYGLSLNGASNQITDEQGLITVDLIQSTSNIDSQLDHESLLTVMVDTRNGIVKQTLPILVSGTNASNVVSSKNTINSGENFRISGQILDGSAQPISNADVTLYSNDKEAGKGNLDNNGNFVFDLNAANLVAANNNYIFSIEVSGTKIQQRIPDIVTVVSTVSSSISFSDTSDIVVGSRQQITLSAPNAKNGDIIYISTNKGEILANQSDNQGSSRRGFSVADGRVSFYINSNVPGKAILRAEYGNESRETILSFVSIDPSKLLLQTESSIVSVGGSTKVIARVLDKDDAPVKNAIVQFTTIRDASGGNLGQGVAYTDDSGIATVTYNAGENPTSTNGVNIKAQVKSIRLPNGQEKAVNSIQKNSEITVQTKSTYISFAFSDKVSSDTNEIYYFRKGSVSVLNSAGKPTINQQVSINLNPNSYLKGFFNIFQDASGGKSWDQNSITCDNEDKNNNGILDVDEDFNSNGQLDPINVAAILTENGQEIGNGKNFTFSTDNTGKVDFSIRYPKQYANWYRANVTVNTRVDGSESQQSRVIDFPASPDDIDISIPLRPNTNSPFGTQQNCSSSS